MTIPREYFSGKERGDTSKEQPEVRKASQVKREQQEDESMDERVRRNIEEHGA
jgi:hypothetical protein